MPSSPGYKRNYKQEAAAESPERKKQRAMRNSAHRAYESTHGNVPAGMDVDHRHPLSKGGSNAASNLGLQDSNTNRSYPRNADGSMKSATD